MKLQKSIIALLALFVFALTANAQFGDLINKAKDKVDKAQKKVEQTTGQTSTQTGGSPTNNGGGVSNGAKNVKLGAPGSIGLSKSPIDPKNWQAAKYETQFGVGDNIYAIVFFGEPVTTLGINNTNQEMIVWFDNGSGTMTDYWGIPIKPEQKDATFITLPINPAPSDVFNQNDFMAADRFLGMARKYNNQKVTVKMLAGGDQQAQAVVSFDFANANSLTVARAEAMHKAVVANSDKANANTEILQSGMNNPTLAKQFTAMINGAGAEWKMLKLIIASPEWQIDRHEISGVIVARHIVTRNIVKHPNGVCQIQSITFFQDYNGSGYGKTYMDVAMGRTDDYIVSCAKVK